MTRATTMYKLTKDGREFLFQSEMEACDFVGVTQCTVASCFRSGAKCKGYSIERLGISTHGETATRLHKIWSSMKERCYRSGHSHYADYGGRGIEVCEEWRNDFPAFKKWAEANGYANNLSIDRKDVNGDYSPENCRWATMREQQNNKRSNHLVSYNGATHTITEWADMLGINKTTIKERLRCGWTAEKALTTPVRKRTSGADMRGSP